MKIYYVLKTEPNEISIKTDNEGANLIQMLLKTYLQAKMDKGIDELFPVMDMYKQIKEEMEREADGTN